MVSLLYHFLEFCCSIVLPFDGVGSGNTFGGGGVFRGNALSLACYVMPILASFLFFRLPFSLSGVFSLSGYLVIVIF